MLSLQDANNLTVDTLNMHLIGMLDIIAESITDERQLDRIGEVRWMLEQQGEYILAAMQEVAAAKELIKAALDERDRAIEEGAKYEEYSGILHTLLVETQEHLSGQLWLNKEAEKRGYESAIADLKEMQAQGHNLDELVREWK
jgi:hypothetical protein